MTLAPTDNRPLEETLGDLLLLSNKEQDILDSTSLQDNGGRQTFGEGSAVREFDPEKPRTDLFSPYSMLRLGRHFALGAQKYSTWDDQGNLTYDGGRNWEKGMPFSRYTAAILRHTFQYMMRDDKEDHLAAIMWNAHCLMHHEEVGDAEQLDDRPSYN